MTPKTTNTTMNPPFSAESMNERNPADLTAQWHEARLVYPIYAALATQFDLAPLPYAAGEQPPEKPSREAFDGDLKWLAALDEKVLAYQIRQLPSQILNGSEQALRALIQRQLRKVDKTNADRDKIDLLLVQYFVMCAAEDLLHKEITLSDVARVLGPVLVEADATPLEWCEPLDKILDKTKNATASGHDGGRPSGTGPHAEGRGRPDVLRSRRAGCFLPLQLPAASRFHSHAACRFERGARCAQFARSEGRKDG